MIVLETTNGMGHYFSLFSKSFTLNHLRTFKRLGEFHIPEYIFEQLDLNQVPKDENADNSFPIVPSTGGGNQPPGGNGNQPPGGNGTQPLGGNGTQQPSKDTKGGNN